MENKNSTVFTFITQVLMLFAVDILILMFFAALFGEAAREMSTMYQFGKNGLASSTMLQFLISSITVTSIKTLLFSDRVFKKMMALWRTVITLICILITHIFFIVAFGWFSFNNLLAWAGFLICFIGGFSLGLLWMLLKNRNENRRYDRLLSEYKDLHEEEEENE